MNHRGTESTEKTEKKKAALRALRLCFLSSLCSLCLCGSVSAQPPASFDKAAPAWTLPWDADWVTAVAFVGPKRVAAGNNLGQILVWDLPEKPGGPAPSPVLRLDGHDNTV